MGKAYSDDLRWRAVFGVWHEGLSYAAVAERLSMGPMTVSVHWVKAMWELFVKTGDVESHQGQRDARMANALFRLFKTMVRVLSEHSIAADQHLEGVLIVRIFLVCSQVHANVPRALCQ